MNIDDMLSQVLPFVNHGKEAPSPEPDSHAEKEALLYAVLHYPHLMQAALPHLTSTG